MLLYMVKNNGFCSNKSLIVILIIIAILLFINIFLYIKKNIYESFINSENDGESIGSHSKKSNINNIHNINLGINFQSGISNINPTGTINFSKKFSKIPMVFTQIIGSKSTISNVYSIQVFDITNASFNYSKNKAHNNVQPKQDTSEALIIPKISKSNTEQFLWFAIG